MVGNPSKGRTLQILNPNLCRVIICDVNITGRKSFYDLSKTASRQGQMSGVQGQGKAHSIHCI